ncbi:MAG TPA: SIS domain-containing protein [Rhabdochlamydiaceae bacterium]|jgi:D-sedoheptulose 7-phosphate isomerase|nr:SIS domain-containing protein [Rhabdochlamydiaceae bacterium]
MQEKILQSVDDGVRAIEFLKKPESLVFIQNAARLISDCFKKGGKLLIAGNGGSLCDAMHFAEEMTGIFRHKRKALPAIALSDPGHLSCMANDIGYHDVFSRSVEALGREGDVFVALTTSGNSQNIVLAVEIAKAMGLKTISFLGKTGGKLKGVSDLEWIVQGFSYSDRIQEAHMTAIHIIIEMIEHELFYA